PGLVRVRTGRGSVTARVATGASPASVRRDNVDRVVSVLTAAGVDWFRVPCESFTHTAVAVPEKDKDHVLALLRAATAPGAGRLAAIGAGGRRARVWRASWAVTDAGGSLVLGDDFGCDIEFWREQPDGTLAAPRGNPVADVVAAHEEPIVAFEPAFSEFCAPYDSAAYRTRRVFTLAPPDRVCFPVDAVFTWVDGDDPVWRRRKDEALAAYGQVHPLAANDSRYASRDELRYAMRAVHCFAPWIRRIFLVTDDQVPDWLDAEHPDVTVVSHREIFGDTGRLPTFNSQAIESRLHRIPGLAEHFLYLNDDVLLGRPVSPRMFFTPGGLTRFFPSPTPIGPGGRSPDDVPAQASGKNNRRLIQETFGRMLTKRMRHTPHPSRRSVLAEIEERFPGPVAATAAHQFRHPDDVAVLSSLQQYYGYLTGRAVPGEIRYSYTDLAAPSTPFRLARLLRDRHLDAFCLNDVDADAPTSREQAGLIADFLPAYLPFRAPFEPASPIARQKVTLTWEYV
ncbi:stealth family protein, partial [Actinoplanes sp. NPDC051633]|uniref:stealth family protein n=1 Tax=Actinoplanes sp. NPDC051633 TaxID=3155670 RepID=UPI003434F0A5